MQARRTGGGVRYHEDNIAEFELRNRDTSLRDTIMFYGGSAAVEIYQFD